MVRPLSTVLEQRLRRPDSSARLLVEIDKVTNAKIVDTKAEWNTADSLTGIKLRPDGTVRLTGTQTTLVSSLAETQNGTTLSNLDREGPTTLIEMALVSIAGVNRNTEFDQIIARLDPDPLGTGRIVDEWVCQIYSVNRVTIDDAGDPGGPGVSEDILDVTPLGPRGGVGVVEGGTVDHEVTFNFPHPFTVLPRPDATGAGYPQPTMLIEIRGITNAGNAAANIAWITHDATSFTDMTTGSKVYGVRLQNPPFGDPRRAGEWRIDAGGNAIDVPLVKLGYLAYVNDDVTFTTNPLAPDPVGAQDLDDNPRLVGRARVPPGTAVRYNVRNTANTAWLEYDDGDRLHDIEAGYVGSAATSLKMRVEIDKNTAGDVTPEVQAMGFEYVTSIPMYDVADVESVEEIVDPQTLKGRISEIRVRGYRDGVHDFNAAIDRIVSENDIADLSISVYWGHPDDPRSTWTLKNRYPIIDDIENDGHSHVIIAVCPLAFLRGGPTGERRLPRYDVVTEKREELIYDGTATKNAPSEIWNDLIKVQLGVPGRWVGAPPEDVTLRYLDDAGVSQTIDLATTTAIKKRIADSEGHDEVDAQSFLAGHATTSSQGKIKAVRMRGGEGPIRAIFSADDIRWTSVSPGFRHRRPVQFTEYNFWDSPDDPDEVRAFHQNAIDNLGGGRIQGIERTPEIIGSWITSKALAEAIGAREIQAFGPGLMVWGFESIWPYIELEAGDRVAVEVDRFAAKDPNVARELRGALWAVGRIVGIHDPWHTRFSLHIENFADIIGLNKVVTRIGISETVGADVTKSGTQAISHSGSGLFIDLISFDTEYLDSDAFHDNVTNNEKITVPANWLEERYQVKAVIPYTGLSKTGTFSVTDLTIKFEKNDVTPLGSVNLRDLPASGEITMLLDGTAEDFRQVLAGGDSFKMKVQAALDAGESFAITIGAAARFSVLRHVGPVRAVHGTPQARPPGLDPWRFRPR